MLKDGCDRPELDGKELGYQTTLGGDSQLVSSEIVNIKREYVAVRSLHVVSKRSAKGSPVQDGKRQYWGLAAETQLLTARIGRGCVNWRGEECSCGRWKGECSSLRGGGERCT